MDAQASTQRTRRAVLAGAVGGAAAAAAASLAGPVRVLAANGDNVVLGTDNSATSVTKVENTTGAIDAVALQGVSAQGVGLVGSSTSGQGVIGYSSSGAGVQGYSETDAGLNGFGPLGVWAGGDNEGCHGISPAGIGVVAESSDGIALKVIGKATLTRSGIANIAAGKSYVDVTVSGGLTPRSIVHATLQVYRAGAAVAAVRRNYPSAGKARIYLTKVASKTVTTAVGWSVVERP
jgi:hypothetical protein